MVAIQTRLPSMAYLKCQRRNSRERIANSRCGFILFRSSQNLSKRSSKSEHAITSTSKSRSAVLLLLEKALENWWLGSLESRAPIAFKCVQDPSHNGNANGFLRATRLLKQPG